MGMDWDPEGDADRRKQTRNRIFAAVGITAAILVFVARKVIEASNEREREHELEIASRVQQELATMPPPPSPPADDLESTTRDICRKLLACERLDDTKIAAQIDDCIRAQTQRTDGFAHDLVTSANREVLATCGALPCDQFPICYLDTLKKVAGAPPATPIPPDKKAKLIALVCAVARENAGKVPDLKAANRSKKTAQLDTELSTLNVSAVADLMKEALATCH